ncbi:MurR/RpiR family transcriptional regulator [Streptacidiphilus sp. P02-A3a]|uniref:MurR/RpiR family transcriptional regulator n=1 Tax=Streptacidiphilus sp. P02-A3a TaxID=2704468 RepID=UPI0015F8F035|nr:MurR/RpiR family transcriptional regulator [Streptacidiphilus sp. P02-A3a]QMU70980.1 MurR/RpiR family transcriptional regulator [Streptacidiphilus sp. P02-A3a]
MENDSTSPGAGVQQLSAHIRARLPELRDTEARVAQVFLEQGSELVRLSVSDVAALAGTAPSSVVRACQRLGFRGYQEVKIAAARQAPRPAPPTEDDPAGRALAHTVQAAHQVLDGLLETVSVKHLRSAARTLNEASRVLVFGAGLSGAVALDAGYRLRALGCVVDVPADPMTAQLSAGLLGVNDACLAISHSGATRSTVDAARRARLHGATIVALTSYANSPLSETSTCTLVAGSQELVLGLEAVASRLAHLAVVDALTMTLLSLRGPDAERALALSQDVTADHVY